MRIHYSWVRVEYNNPEVLITENGWSDEGELQDDGRINYLRVSNFWFQIGMNYF